MIKRIRQAWLMNLGMFTNLPFLKNVWQEDAAVYVLRLLPLTGLLLGGLWWLLYRALLLLSLPLPLQAVLMALFPWFSSGFLHLDGFMDTSDALLSRRDRAEQLRILKDPHTGAFAVISLACLFSFQLAAAVVCLSDRPPYWLFLWIPFTSRLLTAIALLRCPALPNSSLAVFFQKGNGARQADLLLFLFGVSLVIAFIYCGPLAFLLLLLQTGCFLLPLQKAIRQLGGISGDLSGYALTLCETGAFFGFACLVHLFY
ncbi:MAG: adenosylcobinamide-GDP ribazoletransferase [Negativicutes bacterium]|nr:adenosylcobinamide-GDP ribazoletransferase [Negativicutes bacterium]